MTTTYKISDSVWHRVVQIIQEAMLTGVDCADLLRQVRVEIDSDDETQITLTEDYLKQVQDIHAKYLEEIEKMKTSSPTILSST